MNLFFITLFFLLGTLSAEMVHADEKVFLECDSKKNFEEHCGLISSDAVNGYKNYHKKHCDGKTKKSCETDFKKMMMARFKLRYPKANWEKVDNTFTANPDEYDSLDKIETEVLLSHDQTIDTETKEAESLEKKREIADSDVEYEAVSKQQAEEETRRQTAISAAFKSINTSLNPPPPKPIDISCMNRCTNSGSSSAFCQSKCSY